MGTNPRAVRDGDRRFAENLPVVRKAVGLTGSALGAALTHTISRSGISQIETGDRNVTVGEAVDICRVLGVSLELMASGRVRAKPTVVIEADL